GRLPPARPRRDADRHREPGPRGRRQPADHHRRLLHHQPLLRRPGRALRGVLAVAAGQPGRPRQGRAWVHQLRDPDPPPDRPRPPNAGTIGAGGLLTGPGNIGSSTTGRFSVVPEVGMNLGYYVTDWMRLSVGYNFLYWSGVARPGEQIDRRVNLNNAFGS